MTNEQEIKELLEEFVKHGNDIDDNVMNAPKLDIDTECEYWTKTIKLSERAKVFLEKLNDL